MLDKRIKRKDQSSTFSVSVDLTYDPSILAYLTATEGAWLNRNGVEPPTLMVALENNQPGHLVIGLTRLGTLPEVSGDGTVVTLSFRFSGIFRSEKLL